MKLSIISTALLFVILHSSPVSAQMTQAETVAACVSALKIGDKNVAKDAADTIKSWRYVFSSKLLEGASECMSKALPEPWTYDYVAGSFRPAAEVAEQKALQAEKLEEQKRKVAEDDANRMALAAQVEIDRALAASRKAANDQRVLNGIIMACRNLLKSSRDAAFLNPVCVESFLRDGLPQG